MEQAIKKSIEGGWKNGEYELMKDEMHGYGYQISASSCFLKSEFWQCLGKAMGWETRRKCCEGCGSKERLVQGEYHDICSSCHRGSPKLLPEWKFNWHRFIDHLAEGRIVDNFFEELLK